MTPEERNLVSELFERLATLEGSPRDPDAERTIREGLRQAPNSLYALVQTTLLQDEALKQADDRIRALEAEVGSGAAPARQGSFLGGMRDNVWGRPGAPRAGSVPSVRPSDPATSAPMGAPPGYPAQAPGQAAPAPGGSFLGTAAAAAAGMIGGSLLMNSMRSMMGGNQHSAGNFGSTTPAAAAGSDASPWSNAAGGNLAREAGLDDIGRGTTGRGDGGNPRGQGLFDNDATGDNTQNAGNDEQYNAETAEESGDFADDDGGDFGGGDDGEE